MTRREFSWTDSESQALVAYEHVIRIAGTSWLLAAMEKSPIRPNGRPRYFKGDGSVQEVTRTIRIFRTEEEYAEVDLVGQRWRGRFSRTHWHVAQVRYYRGKVWGTTTYRYQFRTSCDPHDPYWSGPPVLQDLHKVLQNGELQPVAA